MSQVRLSFLLPLVAFGILALVGGMALYGTLSGSRDPTQLPSVFVDKPAPHEAARVLHPRQGNLDIPVGIKAVPQ